MMLPGVNPRQMQAMMRQMGISQTDVNASQVVIIKKDGSKLIFDAPDVQKIIMQGNTSFQITGSYKEVAEQLTVSISDDDIEMVSNQANVSKEKARKALEDSKGDIAQAIVSFS